MSTTDIGVEKLDVTCTLRDVAQSRLRHTTTVGEALYHQATAKAAALAILAEFPDAAALVLEPSDQDGCRFSPGAILAVDGSVIADDAWGVPSGAAARWNAVMDQHYGPLADLPDEYVFADATREVVPPYPWLLTIVTDRAEYIGRLDLHAAAAIDLSRAVAAAFPEPPETVLDGRSRSVGTGRPLTDTEIATLAMDAVVVPAAVIDTGARHHVELPPWPVDLPTPAMSGGRLPDGATYLAVLAGEVEVLAVEGVWNGERYAEEYRWHDIGAISLNQLDQVEAWALAAWVRLTDALDNVVDHAVGTAIDPVLARIATDAPTPSADVLADLSAHGVNVPAVLPRVHPASPSLADLTPGMRRGARRTLADLDVPDLPGFSGVYLRKASEHAFTVDAVITFDAAHLSALLTAATGLDGDYAGWWAGDNRDVLLGHLERTYQARSTRSLMDPGALQVRFTVPGVPATVPALAVGDHVYTDPNIRAFLDDHHAGRLWRDAADVTGLPREGKPTLAVDDVVVPFPQASPPHLSGPTA